MPNNDALLLAIDFNSLASYLAYAPSVALANETGVPLKIFPYQTTARRVIQDHPSEEARSHFENRDTYVAMDVARYTRLNGLDVKRKSSEIDSSLASKALIVAGDRGISVEVAGTLFAGLWNGSLDSRDSEAIARVVRQHGFEESFDFDSVDLNESRVMLRELGVFTVPTYVLGEEVFHGREHLPMIRWLITDRNSQSPI